MNTFSRIRQRLRSTAKDVAYSRTARSMAARAMQRPEDSATKHLIEAWNLQDSVRRLATDPLPEGHYYAKLTIKNCVENRGRQFRLFQNDVLVYGGEIVRPTNGDELVFRNFVVTSRDPRKFHLNIDVPYSLTIGPGAFTTAPQEKYDANRGIHREGRLYLCTRGNTTSPRKIIFSFPPFATADSQVPYPVNRLRGITNEDLSQALIIAFQDRYLSSGTYLLKDSAGNSLKESVCAFMRETINRYGLSEDDVLIYGAHQGASSALIHAADFPRARLVLVSPQMNLRYYLNNPRFRHQLGRDTQIVSTIQPMDLFSEYAGTRDINIIYTHSAERCNFSAVEFLTDRPRLNRYRINASESEIESVAMPTILNIIQRFLHSTPAQGLRCTGVKFIEDEDHLFAQVRFNPTPTVPPGGNWHLVIRSGSSRLNQLISNHEYPFVKYTRSKQGFNRVFDPVDHLREVIYLLPDGTSFRAKLPRVFQGPEGPGNHTSPKFGAQHLVISEPTQRTYALVAGTELSRFEYISRPMTPEGNRLEIHVVHTLRSAYSYKPARNQINPTSHLVVVRPLDSMDHLRTFALRLAIITGAEHLRIVLHRDDLDAEDLRRLGTIEWMRTQIVAMQPIADFDEHADPFRVWLDTHRLALSKKAKMKPFAPLHLPGAHR